MPRPTSISWSSSLLRRDLSARAEHLARTQKLLHDISSGSDPVVIFGRDEQGRHGNFHAASYDKICANPVWLRRLSKVHTASRRSRARKDWRWMELDSCNSSDALLMNIFCHPGVFDGHNLIPAVANLLNVEAATRPCFGVKAGVPLLSGRSSHTDLKDRTEIDLQLGNLFLEAKLTESDFQTAAPRLIERYRDFETVFNPGHLPRKLLYIPAAHPPAEDYSQLEEPTATPPPSKSDRKLLTHRHPRLPTHPQRSRGLRSRRLLLRSLRCPPSRPHRDLVLRSLRRAPPHLRRPAQTPNLAGTSRRPPR